MAENPDNWPGNSSSRPVYYMSLFGVGRIYTAGAWKTEDWKMWYYALVNDPLIGPETGRKAWLYAVNGVNDISNLALPPGFYSEEFQQWMKSEKLTSGIYVHPNNWIEDIADWVRRNGTAALVVGAVLIASVTLLPWAKMGERALTPKPAPEPSP